MFARKHCVTCLYKKSLGTVVKLLGQKFWSPRPQITTFPNKFTFQNQLIKAYYGEIVKENILC